MDKSGSGEVTVKGEGFAKPSLTHHFETRGIYKRVVAFVMSPQPPQYTMASISPVSTLSPFGPNPASIIHRS